MVTATVLVAAVKDIDVNWCGDGNTGAPALKTQRIPSVLTWLERKENGL